MSGFELIRQSFRVRKVLFTRRPTATISILIDSHSMRIISHSLNFICDKNCVMWRILLGIRICDQCKDKIRPGLSATAICGMHNTALKRLAAVPFGYQPICHRYN